ncbi:putative transcription factor bHLH family [Rosa chinensis]|uniref:Putative transcription factor bHLH family n=1 Tax=Rosa chinensis TaxID=74649 RepID=A0A2P6RLY4_ROSCH|nr:transcription factor bHLH121 [Rosa chinensis]PRQ47411.1 putative transcription factor bHLH family [Rosa chinensis]
MDQWKGDDFAGVSAPSSSQPLACDSRKRADLETKDPVSARKVQKADREKLRRDRLNEHFLDLGNTLDPDRPKNDKATILIDTIQMLKDLTSDVNKLKAECAALNDESRELTVEKNELREEKASLKSDIENLNAQYQQRVRVMFPWGAMDPSVVMAPPYSYPMPVAVPPGPIPMHPSLQPFPYYQTQNPATVPNSCPTFVSYPTPINRPIEQPLPQPQYASVSHVSSKQDSKSKSSDHQRGSNAERCDGSNDVATELVLKMPGSSAHQESSCGARKGKQSRTKDRNITDGSCSSRYSSSQVVQESSSNSVGDIPKTNK